MKIKTITSEYCSSFDKEVNNYLREGWKLKKRTILEPIGTDRARLLYAELFKPDEAPAPDPEEEHRRIMLEPDVAYLVEIKRGKSTRDDYVNTALELGMLVMDKWSGKVDAAINELFDISEHHEEEADNEQ